MRAILTNLMMRRPAATTSHNKNIFRLVSVITKIMPHKKLIASYRYVKNRNMSFLLLPWPCIPPTTFSVKIYTKIIQTECVPNYMWIIFGYYIFSGFRMNRLTDIDFSFIFFHQRSINIWTEMLTIYIKNYFDIRIKNDQVGKEIEYSINSFTLFCDFW